MAGALAQGSVSAALVHTTARAAALVAAGHLAAVSTPAALLMKEVMKTMVLKRLRLVLGGILVLAMFALGGIAYQAGGGTGVALAAPADRPASELDVLRRENELLKLNLQVVLEKLRAEESELRDLRSRSGPGAMMGSGMAGGMGGMSGMRGSGGMMGMAGPVGAGGPSAPGAMRSASGDNVDVVKEAEAAIKQLREARDRDSQRRAADALEKAMKKLREQLNKKE